MALLSAFVMACSKPKSDRRRSSAEIEAPPTPSEAPDAVPIALGWPRSATARVRERIEYSYGQEISLEFRLATDAGGSSFALYAFGAGSRNGKERPVEQAGLNHRA